MTPARGDAAADGADSDDYSSPPTPFSSDDELSDWSSDADGEERSAVPAAAPQVNRLFSAVGSFRVLSYCCLRNVFVGSCTESDGEERPAKVSGSSATVLFGNLNC